MNAVVVENLFKTYPISFPRLKKFLRLPLESPVEALKDISFEIETGEIFGLIGRNGAGKTTLSKIIATLVQPTSGRVLVKGFDSVKDEVKVRSLIGLATAEERSFYWRLTAAQNLLFFARLYGMKDDFARRRIVEIFERLNLTELSKRRFSELSTGNKQKLAIARALLAEPPILLLDEPTRSLDPFAAEDLRQMILSLENVSILLTSHNLSEIEKLCRRVAIISEGEIRALDTPLNLRSRHKQTQLVKIISRGVSEIFLREILTGKLNQLAIENSFDETLKISFTREADDAILGETIALLTTRGAKILEVETEKPSLLDVLENYK